MLTFLDPLVLPVHDALVALPVWIPTAVGVVLLTVLVRLALHPLNRSVHRSGLRRKRMAPRLRELQRTHRSDRQRLREELRKAHAEEGLSPAAGCQPVLLQWPVLAVVYHLFSFRELAGQPNEVLDNTLGGLALGARLWDAGGGWWVFALLLLGLAVVATGAMRLTRRVMAESAPPPPEPGQEPDPQAEATRVIGRIAPWMSYGTVLAAAVVPLAAGVYLLTTTSWTLLERLALRRWVRS